jgi:hypothetical protein
VSSRERTIGTGYGEPPDEPSGAVDLQDGRDAERGFGDGSNRWIDGFRETVNNPVDRLRNPYDTVAGAADAAALNFDEGVGGLVSLADDEAGNTAGPGQDDIDVPATGVGASDDEGRSVDDNPLNNTLEGDGPLGIGPEQIVLLVGAVVALVLLRPLLQIGAGVVD